MVLSVLKICLINPPQFLSPSLGFPTVFQPLGLAYIAAVLEKEYVVKVIDANAEGWKNLQKIGDKYYSGLSSKEIEKGVKRIGPDIVGISAQFSVNEASVLNTTSIIKGIDRSITTVLGGPHVTVRPMETLLNPNVDYVVLGEGEHTIVDLIKKLEERKYSKLHDVSGIGYKKNNKPIITSPRAFITNLDSVPFPARHLLPMKKYFKAAKAGRGSRGTYTLHHLHTSIITSRGCPYNCVFCSIHLSMGRGFRARSPENVVEEIEHVVHKYGLEHINFEDDNMTLDKNRFKIICDLLVERGLDITWSAPNGIRADTLDDELVRKMRESGCRRVFVAPESGDQYVVKHIVKKNLDLKKIEEAVIMFKRNGIVVDGSFVIGLIGEKKENILRTIAYALKLRGLGLNDAGFHIATPLYGTELYNQAKEKGYLVKDIDSSLMNPNTPLIETPDLSINELLELKKLANWMLNTSFRRKFILTILDNRLIQHIGLTKLLKKYKDKFKLYTKGKI